MAAVDPDLAILWGVREIMSLVGILITTLSYWYAGRKWDEEGTAAYNVAVEASMGGDYQNVEEGLKNQKFVTNADGSRDAISVTTEDFRSPPDLIQVPIDRLEKAMSKNYGIILGLVVWAISFLFQPGRPVRVYVGWNISFILFLPLIAALLAFPMRRATIDRNLELKKKGLSFLLILSTWLVISGIADRKTDAPWYFCSLGALFVFFSYHIMRRSRKMGVSWDAEGKPASKVSVQHLGALSLILGFFLIWIGTNGVQYIHGAFAYALVPIYLNYRSWLVFISGLLIILPANLALDYAFDNGSKPVEYLWGSGWLFKLDGSTFTESSKDIPYFSVEFFVGILETPWPLVSGWIFFGLCAFMPFGAGFTFQKMFACMFGCLVGTIYGLQVLPAYWNGDLALYQRWTYIYYSSMLFLFTCIGLDGQGPLISSMIGVFLILLGQYFGMLENKRGKFWIQQGESNPREFVYNYGNPTQVMGWILLCMAMSIPMI